MTLFSMMSTAVLYYSLPWAPLIVLCARATPAEAAYYSVALRVAGFMAVVPNIQVTYLAPIMAGYGLDIVGGWYSSSLLVRDARAEIAAMAAHLALLEHMGSSVFILAETSNAVHGDREDRVPAVGEDVERGARGPAVRTLL